MSDEIGVVFDREGAQEVAESLWSLCFSVNDDGSIDMDEFENIDFDVIHSLLCILTTKIRRFNS